jgi:hypothetical protein
LNIVVSSLSLPILGISNLHQKLYKSQTWNPNWNLQYHSKKTFMNRLFLVFIDLLLHFKFVEMEIRKETRIKIVKANNLTKKHDNWTKFQMDEKLSLHSSMLKIKIFFTIYVKFLKNNNLWTEMHFDK